jgi:ParB-like chromosome segregation protein Spo0J
MKKFSIALLVCSTITCGLCAGGGSSSQEEVQKSIIAQSETSEQTTSTIEALRKKRLRSSRSSLSEYQIDSLFGPSSSTPIEDLSAGLIEDSGIQRTTPTPNASVIYDNDSLLDQLLSDLEKEQQPKDSTPQIHRRPKFEKVLEALQNNDAEFFKKYYERLDYKDDHRWIQLAAEAQTNITDQKTNFKTAKEALIKSNATITQTRGGLTRALMIQQYIHTAQKQLAYKESCERIEELKQMVQLHRQERIAQMLAFSGCKTK